MAESFVLPNIVTGGQITVQASSLQQAQQAAAAQTGVSLAAQQGGGTFGVNTNHNIGGSGGGGGGGGPAVAQTQTLGTNDIAAIQQAFGASSGFSIKQLEESKRQFDAQLAQAKDQMERIGIPQLEIQKRLADAQIAFQNSQMELARQNEKLQEAGVSGYYTSPQSIAAYAARNPQAAALLAINPSLGDPAYQQTLLNSRGYIFQPGEDLSAPTEQARQFNNNLGLQYLTQASQFAASDPFQLSDFMRGAAASNSNLPTFLHNLQNNVVGSAAGSVGPQPTAATTLPQLSAAMQGQGQVNPQTGTALNAIGGIYNRGANQLGTGTLESLGQNELNTLAQGITRLYGQPAAAAFLEQYKNTRPAQTATRTSYY